MFSNNEQQHHITATAKCNVDILLQMTKLYAVHLHLKTETS